jgi:gag-polypeptide of LTR copia-type
MSSNNGINNVPVFSGANFRTWQQTMGDYLRSMRLFRHVSGATVRPTPVVLPTQANLDAIVAWDEADEQAQDILGLRLSTNLCTHLGATAHALWQAMDNAFGQPGISSEYADLQAALHVKISGSQNLQVEMQQLLTLFERLRANGMQINDPIQGMMLLNALPSKWDGVAIVYLQGQKVLANVTFASVRDAIMAEFEQTSHPLAWPYRRFMRSNVKASPLPLRSRLALTSCLPLKLLVTLLRELLIRRKGEVAKRPRCTL